MLAPHEFFIGPISQATGLTFVRVRGSRDWPMLVSDATGKRTAVFLDGEFVFSAFDCEQNTHWSGILVPNVRVEVDDTVIAPEGAFSAPLGALVRKDTRLLMVTKYDHGRTTSMVLAAELPPCADGARAVFVKWRILLGQGLNQRELMSIDRLATPPT